MRNLLTAFADGLRCTMPFQGLPPDIHPTDVVMEAHNNTNLGLRLPLYHQRLKKPRPKSKIYDSALQGGLAVLAAFASAAGTCQAIVSIENGEKRSVSFQPRPFDANWTSQYAIEPAGLRDNRTDPLPTPNDFDVMGQATELSTRSVLHLAGKVATVLMNSAPGDERDGVVTFVFDNTQWNPQVRAIWRPRRANIPAHVVNLIY